MKTEVRTERDNAAIPKIINEGDTDRYASNTWLESRYFIHKIARGGQGCVLFCYDQQTDDLLALKTLKGGRIEYKKSPEHFHHEIEVWNNLDKHPNIVTCRGWRQIDSQPFIGMDWIANDTELANYYMLHQKEGDFIDWFDKLGAEGPMRRILSQREASGGIDLARKLNKYGPLCTEEAVLLLLDIARGLNYANQFIPYFVHADLKPSNILLRTDSVAAITDFGIANLTGSGTPGYQAPEVLRNSPPMPCSDVYAFGCLLYKILTCKDLFNGTNAKEIRKATLSGNFTQLPNNVPEELKNFYRHCLSLSPDKRYKDAEAVFHKLLEIAENLGIQKIAPLNQNEENTPQYLSNKGFTFHRLKRFENAISCYEKALSIDGNFIPAINNRGITYFAKGDFLKARRAFDHTLRHSGYIKISGDNNDSRDPVREIALYNRGILELELKRYSRSTEDFSQAVGSTIPDALHGLACSLYYLGETNQALEILNQIKLNDLRVIANRCLLCKAVNDEDGVKQYLEFLKIHDSRIASNLQDRLQHNPFNLFHPDPVPMYHSAPTLAEEISQSKIAEWKAFNTLNIDVSADGLPRGPIVRIKAIQPPISLHNTVIERIKKGEKVAQKTIYFTVSNLVGSSLLNLPDNSKVFIRDILLDTNAIQRLRSQGISSLKQLVGASLGLGFENPSDASFPGIIWNIY